jgi:surface antigen
MTLPPGVYKWGTGLLIPTNVTLTGSATDVWIFQIAKSLTVSNGVKIVLGGAALPKNVFWQVSGLVSVGTTAHLEGIVLSQTSITLDTGASINGRLLAQTAVALQVSTVVEPAPWQRAKAARDVFGIHPLRVASWVRWAFSAACQSSKG